jgi:anti-anti-sigma regulatory factor
MDITVQSYTGLTVVVAQGLLNERTFLEIEEALKRAPTENRKQVWLEGTHIHRVPLTQTCLCTFIDKLLMLRKQGIPIVLFGASGSTRRMLTLLQLDKLFRQVPTLEDAYLLINKQPESTEAVVR